MGKRDNSAYINVVINKNGLVKYRVIGGIKMEEDKKITLVELITKLQNLINRASLAGVDSKYYEGLFDEVERLKEPVTLAEFLGWEEGKEYRNILGKYLIVDDSLYFYDDYNQGWQTTAVCLSKSFIESMRNAKPIFTTDLKKEEEE